MERDIIYTARNLAVLDRRKPRQANLRRAASSAYYALFHCLAEHCADLLVGGAGANRSRQAWRQTYRGLQHGVIRKRCQDRRIREFSEGVQDFAAIFCTMQTRRHEADYDPYSRFSRLEVIEDIGRVQNAITCFENVSDKDRRAFAVYVLLPLRG